MSDRPTTAMQATLTFVAKAAGYLLKRFRLLRLRVLKPYATIGPHCSIGPRVVIRQATGAKLVIGRGCVLDNDLIIEVGGNLMIGERTIFGHHCTLASQSQLFIGNDCLIAEMVSIRDHDHCFESLDTPVRDQGPKCAKVTIGNDVWIGAKATITKGVTIGDQAIIGANAVVTHNIPPRAIAVGIPAKVIRYRNDDVEHSPLVPSHGI